MAGGHMRVLLVELLGFIPARFSVDIGTDDATILHCITSE
jgi:hypothetical protein